MPEKFVIIPAKTGHLPFLPGIERAAATIFSRETLPEHIFDDALPPAVSAEAAREGRLWVAAPEGGGDPVGFVLFRVVSGHALLGEVDVLPDYGRRGLGMQLVLRVVRHASECGFREIFLTTFRTVPWNAPFYERLGFAIVPEERLPAFAAAILRAERDAGLRDRVAMRKELPLDESAADG